MSETNDLAGIVEGVLWITVKTETGVGRAIDGARAKWNESYRPCNLISDPPTLTTKRKTEGIMGSRPTALLATALRAFAYVWLALGFLLVVVAIIATWISGGFPAVLEVMSPFNVMNYITMFVMLAPAIFALSWSDRLRARRLRKRWERSSMATRSRA